MCVLGKQKSKRFDWNEVLKRFLKWREKLVFEQTSGFLKRFLSGATISFLFIVFHLVFLTSVSTVNKYFLMKYSVVSRIDKIAINDLYNLEFVWNTLFDIVKYQCT